ncbi:MAG: ribokinase, partial [Spirulinaceae cyanobacterium RM2_2_10]|nr:ribokinase [Spirulinaceae cyanobacterium RM2_2_10]
MLLDPAPASAPNTIPAELYPLLDFITPNTIEAGQLVGFPVEDRQTAERAALILRDRGVGTVLVTLGEQGVLCVSELDAFALPATPSRRSGYRS